MQVRVIRKTDSVYIGSMQMRAGMALTDGRVVAKVSKSSFRSLSNQSGKADTITPNIYLSEAKKHGFKAQ